jgi:hypothetical protein
LVGARDEPARKERVPDTGAALLVFLWLAAVEDFSIDSVGNAVVGGDGC